MKRNYHDIEPEIITAQLQIEHFGPAEKSTAALNILPCRQICTFDTLSTSLKLHFSTNNM